MYCKETKKEFHAAYAPYMLHSEQMANFYDYCLDPPPDL